MGEKTVGQHAIKLIGIHVVGIIISLVLAFAFMTMLNRVAVSAVLGVFIEVVYVIIVGGYAWAEGNQHYYVMKAKKAKAKKDGQEVAEDNLRGVKVALITSIPLGVMAVLVFLAKLSLLPNMVFLLYRILNANTLLPLILINSSTDIANLSFGEVGIMISMLILTPVSIMVGYYLGYKDIAVTHKMIYKSK